MGDAESLKNLTMYHAALLEELETLVEQLDLQEAAKQQALRRAEAAEQELEAVKAEMSQAAAVSAVWVCNTHAPGGSLRLDSGQSCRA